MVNNKPYYVTDLLFLSPLLPRYMDDFFLEATGTVPASAHSAFSELIIPPISDEVRNRRNEKRRQRYAQKHSKKARLLKLHAEKAQLEAEVRKLRKDLKEKVVMPPKKRRTK